ncbi:hypothetical protein NPIL_650451 [Nephila pilipes]|uniref:Uncharacterized protein n=1 Tax=Nephila pilipes TaxID=299642 RepID=A0A8X6Q043_NEPPI|nr:hypothetical protein NPIL_650451 [Nephila pilipes]
MTSIKRFRDERALMCPNALCPAKYFERCTESVITLNALSFSPLNVNVSTIVRDDENTWSVKRAVILYLLHFRKRRNDSADSESKPGGSDHQMIKS